MRNHTLIILGLLSISCGTKKEETEQYTLTLSAGANGALAASPAGPSYAENTVVTVTATPDATYLLQSWSGTDDDTSTSTTNQVTMSANKTVAAAFVSAGGATFTLTLTSAPHRGTGTTWGYIHADPPGQDFDKTQDTSTVQYASGTVVTLTAHQSLSTWAFTGWDLPGGGTATTCSTTVTMDADKTVTANFPLGSGTGCP
jgi:hypothetical protein